MKILIGYTTSSGGSREMAELLASSLPQDEITLADLAENAPDPAKFDYAVIGGCVRIGKLKKPARAYLKKYAAALAAMPHSLFLLCAASEQFEHYLEVSVPRAVLESAEHAVYFGGELNPDRHRGFSRLLVRSLRSSILSAEDGESALPGLLPEHVRVLADALRTRDAR